MALTITQSCAVNDLATYLLGAPRMSSRGEVTVDEAIEALAVLADGAHKALMAGRTGDDVRRDWRARPPAPPRAKRKAAKR